MSRHYPTADYYDERATDFYARPRTERNYDELDVDIRETTSRRAPAQTVLSDRRAEVDRRTERPVRQPDFLREDYGKSSQAGQLVVREDRREEDVYSRAPTRRRSLETVRSRAPPKEVEEREIVIRERDRERPRERDRESRPPYPQSERGGYRDEEIIFRDQARSRAASRPPAPRSKEEIDIIIRKREEEEARSEAARSRAPPARSEYAKSEAPPRSEYHERDVEEIRFRRGGGERPPPPRTVVDREEIDIRETRSPPSRNANRGRDEEIDIRIKETERAPPPPRARSQSRGVLVGKEKEEWIVRRQRSPSPPPPPRDYEKEEIIIRRRERTPTPEPVREPTPPPPPPPPPPEPIVRPPIIQEVITHHRHIDHGVERFREPSPEPPPPPPAPPSPPRDDNLEIEIHRSGTRNGKHFDDDLIIEHRDHQERSRSRAREAPRPRSISASTRRRSPSAGPVGRPRRYDDDIGQEADYYMRRAASRGYPGEAYNGATKDWGLVDVPPGTERVRMDGVGGGSQEISWQRYNGARQSKFYTGDRMYESPDWNERPRQVSSPAPPPAPLPPPPVGNREEEIRITERRIVEETSRGKTKDRMWTEITKDLVIKEAIDEMGYEYEETDEFFYVIEYLRYVSHPPSTPPIYHLLTMFAGGRPQTRRTDRRHPPRATRAHPRDPMGA